MPNTPETPRSFVKPDDEAMIVCPACDAARAISAAQFRHRLHLIKVKCKCGHVYKVHLEFRRNARKNTELEGIYDLIPPAIGGGKIKIMNLSLNGACFEVRGIHDMKVGQRGSLVFTLDNRKETVLFKKVIIKTVSGNRIGAEFIEDRAYEKELGFYLLP
ncbi:PilZ domain-containing protein [Desulfopila sp. IMCC35006]|uniref:PilZ domain-containing protein n=1 Tax=Desulfopila sp. IMCC35006 TaxID=2569542 RepID=UPI0010ABFF18|nr:PilZ domain-containing protein [Desulfopila sp. IMCC35006]TKB26605.1 PilZ domain-containing protein [Desulfopila sp. IMCC35006]